MDEAQKESPPRQDKISAALSLTRDKLADYFVSFESKHGDVICPVCRCSSWAILSRPETENSPAVLTIPLPMTQGRGMWIYPIMCSGCGYILSFSCNYIVNKLKED